MSYKAALLLLAVVAACALAVVAQLSPWALVAILGCAALLCAAAAFRREQHTVDRILFEELYRVEEPIGTSVDATHETPGASVSSLNVRPIRQLPRAS